MAVKYKLSELAKDFGKTSKDISAILSQYGKTTKSGAQVLTDDELNMVSGGNLIPRVFRCGSCNREGPYGLDCACGGRYDVAIR